MEFCWHLLSNKIWRLYDMPEPLYGPKSALKPERTALKLMVNQMSRIE
jgi:hypothetical protein